MLRVVVLVLAVVSGCGSAPPAPGNTSLAQSRLAQAEARAAAQVKSGDYTAASRQYAEALRIALTLEHAESIAANAINLSIVQQWLGHDAEARAALAPVLDNTRIAFSERRKLQAELRRAILELSAGNTPAAAVWAGQAQARCPDSRCEYAAAIGNVRAQVALDSADAAEAARLAQSVAGASGTPRAEVANALRTLGRARQAQGDAAGAIAPLRQALEIDRELGDPRKILADLGELARASDAAGDAGAAREYRERGLAVGRAMNDGRSAADMEALLRRQ
jgi:tetratricopeptide (TPR) repeat protein